jgi:hypothetical protein
MRKTAFEKNVKALQFGFINKVCGGSAAHFDEEVKKKL